VKCGDVIEASPVLSSDQKRLYVGNWDGMFYVLDAASGKILASRDVGSMVSRRSALTPDGKVLVGTKSGMIYCFWP